MINQHYKAQITATFLARSQSTALLTDHVTRGGVFVRTDSPPAVMELLRIELTLPPDMGKIVLHGVVTNVVRPSTKHGAPGVEIAFFAKGGDASIRWDQFITYLREKHPEALVHSVMFARDAIDQVRRAHPRLVPNAPLQLATGEHQQVTVGDISKGGMFIKTSDVYVIGSDLRITLQDPQTFAMIPVDCIVRRRATGANPGIGVEFRNMNDAQREVLDEMMKAAGSSQPVPAYCEEVLAPAPTRMMNTRPGPGTFGGAVSIAPSEDSWTTLDEGWPTA